MELKETRTLNLLGKVPEFRDVIRKLTNDIDLNDNEKSFILSSAILLINHYQRDRRYTSYLDFSYFIILKYSIKYRDFKPLFDISVNLGFYPIANDIIKYSLIPYDNVEDSIIFGLFNKFKNDQNTLETLDQFKRSGEFLDDSSAERCYLAPTSFGKSSLIVSAIKRLTPDIKKIAIIVPTKSLLMQTFQVIKASQLGKKILLHDEMFDNEDEFIAIFTQERALRLINRNRIFYDILFIDEAHNILNFDSRSILLSRLISKNSIKNGNQKIVYLSPLIENINNVRITNTQSISEHKIKHNLKEPDYFELTLDGLVRRYNRFLDEFYTVEIQNNHFKYTLENSGTKNFIYQYRPIKIEEFAREFCNHLPVIQETSELVELKNILRKEVHSDFYIIDYLKYGLVYIHGKLPDLIKEYLEEKYRTLPELRYIVANSVILEGMNLPIDTLFIYNTHGLHGKDLMNLIGRVNRLNQIFNYSENLEKLMPPVHFINTDTFNKKNSKMEIKIKELRSIGFKDKIENPTLAEFNLKKQSKKNDNSYFKKVSQCQDEEKFISSVLISKYDNLKAYLIESGITYHYNNIDSLTNSLVIKLQKIEDNADEINFQELSVLEKIHFLFIDNENSLNDFEINRLQNIAARDYYEKFILISRKKSLNENIISQFEYFKKKANSDSPKLYFGTTYGEVDYLANGYNKTYVDLGIKTDNELINLSVVKIKMEEEFVGFKLNKLIVFLFDFNLIEQEDYLLYIFGTTDEQKIALTKYGLNISLVSRLAEDDQLKNLVFDEFNNLMANEDFKKYIENVDDFYRFEIMRFIS